MADPAHVELALRGSDAIRQWREANPGVRLDLEGAPLNEMSLREAQLSGSNLRVAKLRNVDLSDADLEGADLRGGFLVGTMLRGAKMAQVDLRTACLIDAQLIGTDLRGGDLRKVDLHRSFLHGARLDGADVTGAECGATTFANVDLSNVRGLETVVHQTGSAISLGTLARSKGQIPEIFLKGCGLSDWEIEATKLYERHLSESQIVDIQQRVFELRSGQPIQIGSLFVSYSHADGGFVDKLQTRLDDEGIRSWRDIHDATAGRLDRIVDRAMRLNPTVLLVLSEHSVTSDWVEDEADRARALERELGRDVLCPIALDDTWKECQWGRPLRTQIKKYNILSFQEWEREGAFERAFQKLVKGLSIFYQGTKQ